MRHRRENHPLNIQECRDGEFCKFGVNCWYSHTENSVYNSNQNLDTNIELNETLKRLFSMMEKYGEQIEYIEKQMQYIKTKKDQQSTTNKEILKERKNYK